MFIAAPMVDAVAPSRYSKRLNRLEKGTVRIAAVHAELHHDARSENLGNPEGKGNVTNPGRRPDKARGVLQLYTASEENASLECNDFIDRYGMRWCTFSHDGRRIDRRRGTRRQAPRLPLCLKHRGLFYAHKVVLTPGAVVIQPVAGR